MSLIVYMVHELFLILLDFLQIKQVNPLMQDNPRLHHLKQPDDLDSPPSHELQKKILFFFNY